MAIPIYLAMTAIEILNTERRPENMAWMACHFSPYGTGLSDLPGTLPEGSLLILNDRIPIRGHDPNRILNVISERADTLKTRGVLLDFERPESKESNSLIRSLTQLPCPLCVSQAHIGSFDLPVFLPSVPILTTVDEYLRPWKGRRVWLEVSRCGTKISITKSGAMISDWIPDGELPFRDTSLHCHYRAEVYSNAALFYLSRTEEDIRCLLKDAERHGVEIAVGLWQEFGKDAKTAPEAPERS